MRHDSRLRIDHADRAGCRRARDRIAHYHRTAAWSRDVARHGPSSTPVRNEHFPVLLRIRNCIGRNANLNFAIQFAFRSINDCHSVVPAQGGIGEFAVCREGDSTRQRVSLQLNSFCLLEFSLGGEGRDQNAVVRAGSGFAHPQLSIAGAENDPCIRCGSCRDLRDSGTGESIEQEHAACVENCENVFDGIERELDRPAFDQHLFAPRTQQLVGWHKIKTAGLLARWRRTLEDRKDIRLAADESRSSRS